MKAWFEEHFQDDYLRVYDHRDEEKAANELTEIMKYMPLEPGMKAVDLCCGNGRHARWLARRGLHVTGVDLSPALLKKAIELTAGLPVQYMRADIRDVPLLQEYEAAFNLFTSFGYFSSDSENELVFTRASEGLKHNGWFLFDYLNPDYVKQNLVPKDVTEKNGLTIVQERQIKDDYVYKHITLEENDSKREYVERVKLYTQDTLIQMLERNHLYVRHLFGNYNASPFHREHSPRQIFICQKEV
ncbi:class I SAM-dependent methyltransferase [Alteribacillus iranensis]|uniref:Methyltransferase domain-containing protein n=1 Tax=Alteribacillus iranensis TaxID=930128 RepID=A0A1I1ZMP3_9BACI|nr:class I SAM-dependent methyltransferase [Alteribacillus iranensis]SFE32951.1 Methyltransferase domain-containing protein [Alteribacillus iranensis]